jgi:hypothetical protein
VCVCVLIKISSKILKHQVLPKPDGMTTFVYVYGQGGDVVGVWDGYRYTAHCEALFAAPFAVGDDLLGSIPMIISILLIIQNVNLTP